jgi:NADPH:quinone reductase-like Zn-dependent oxidoreductase
VGDDVFGVEGGANAEYVTVREGGVVAPKPAGLTYEEAAAVPDGALIALTCLRPEEPLRGKRVLVYGAAGAIGSAAVQLLAHHFGAEVTAVCDTGDVELVRSLGARTVVDRLRADFTENGETYDVVFDAVGRHSFRRCRRSLRPRGVYLTTGLGFLYHVPFAALLTRLAGRRRARLGVGTYHQEDLLLVRELVESGRYRPVVDRAYDLDDAVEANRYVETGRKAGSVVLRVSTESAGGAAGHR